MAAVSARELLSVARTLKAAKAVDRDYLPSLFLDLLKGEKDFFGIWAVFAANAWDGKDAAFARIEGLDQETMEGRLRVLGYLSMHTRQLDMVMADPRMVAHFAARLRKDLAGVCPLPEAAAPPTPERELEAAQA
jgi:hypothetical protein